MSDTENVDLCKQGTQLSSEDLSRLETLPAGGKIQICAFQEIPSGYVIVSDASSINCPGSFPNAWIIKKPGIRETVCSNSPIPSNYVVVGTGSSINCPAEFPNTKTIRRV